MKKKYNLKLLISVLSLALVFFTKSLLNETYSLADEYNINNNTLNTIKVEYEQLSNIQKEINNSEADNLNIQAYQNTVNDQTISKYFYDYSKKNNININQITISGEQKDDYWFKQKNINIEFEILSKNILLKIINDLNSSTDFNFFIHSIDYSNDEFPTLISLPIKVLYK